MGVNDMMEENNSNMTEEQATEILKKAGSAGIVSEHLYFLGFALRGIYLSQLNDEGIITLWTKNDIAIMQLAYENGEGKLDTVVFGPFAVGDTDSIIAKLNKTFGSQE